MKPQCPLVHLLNSALVGPSISQCIDNTEARVAPGSTVEVYKSCWYIKQIAVECPDVADFLAKVISFRKQGIHSQNQSVPRWCDFQAKIICLSKQDSQSSVVPYRGRGMLLEVDRVSREVTKRQEVDSQYRRMGMEMECANMYIVSIKPKKTRTTQWIIF